MVSQTEVVIQKSVEIVRVNLSCLLGQVVANRQDNCGTGEGVQGVGGFLFVKLFDKFLFPKKTQNLLRQDYECDIVTIDKHV